MFTSCTCRGQSESTAPWIPGYSAIALGTWQRCLIFSVLVQLHVLLGRSGSCFGPHGRICTFSFKPKYDGCGVSIWVHRIVVKMKGCCRSCRHCAGPDRLCVCPLVLPGKLGVYLGGVVTSHRGSMRKLPFLLDILLSQEFSEPTTCMVSSNFHIQALDVSLNINAVK